MVVTVVVVVVVVVVGMLLAGVMMAAAERGQPAHVASISPIRFKTWAVEMAVDWRSALGSHRPLLLNEVAVTPSSTTPTEWPCARLAALPGRWVQKCCRGSGYPVFWHRATPLVKPALSTLRASEVTCAPATGRSCIAPIY